MRLLLPHCVSLAVTAMLGLGCAMPPETPSRWADASGRAEAGPGPDAVPVRVAVAPTLAVLARSLAPIYEGQRPGIDLVLHEGVRTQRLDQPAWLAMRLERGAEAAAYLSESEQQLLELTRTPEGHAAWLGNTLAVVAPRGSSLDESQLTGRRTPVHIALERSALGRWTRASLREAGLWGEVALEAGNFDGGEAIVERVSYFARRQPPEASFGIVFGSDVDPARVGIVGYLDQPRGDPTIHHVAWFSDAGEDFARWLMTDHDARAWAARAGFVVPEGAPGTGP
ncbi:MAG: molybdate ABC transporter substrate-binding protein [Phycisphaerales bacterium]